MATAVAVCAPLTVSVEVGSGVLVGINVLVANGALVLVGTGVIVVVAVGVMVGVCVTVAVAVAVHVGYGVAVGYGVYVGSGASVEGGACVGGTGGTMAGAADTTEVALAESVVAPAVEAGVGVSLVPTSGVGVEVPGPAGKVGTTRDVAASVGEAAGTVGTSVGDAAVAGAARAVGVRLAAERWLGACVGAPGRLAAVVGCAPGAPWAGAAAPVDVPAVCAPGAAGAD